MATLNGLPVYSIKITESKESKTGIDFISLVDCPAIESNWVALSDNKKPLKFSLQDDKQLLLGPILIPDLPIYRYDKDMGEYYVVFKADEIEKIVRKFQSTQKSINLNYQHQKDSQISQAVVQEIWLTGKSDKSKDYGFDPPERSAFVCAHIGDKKFWDEEVKTGKVLGFSIEGLLDMELKKIKMSNQKFEVHKQADGCGDVYLDGPVAVDTYVFSNYPSITLVDGKKQTTQYPVWQETIVLEDGTILTLKDSKILKVEKKQGMSTKKFASAKTDKGIEISCDTETFAAGSEVYTMTDGNKTALSDGDYTLENGSVLKVKDSKITEVVEYSAEVGEEMKKIIQAAIAPLIEAQNVKIAALEAKLSNAPAGPSATTPAATQSAKMTPRQIAMRHLEVIRKKNTELTNKDTPQK